MGAQFCIALTLVFNLVYAENWKPLNFGITYHGNTFPQQAQDRFGLAHLNNPIDAVLGNEQCTLHKVGFNQELYYQYIQYNTKIPDLHEFTLCGWTNFHNHSTDHPIFSYALEKEPRAILAWVSNTDKASYYSLAVGGHTFYRLNYPLMINRWYHSCQSWNGRTGEWQIWVDGERVGRGFYNRLVGNVIKGGGVAISGQEQIEEVEFENKVSRGMLGELTMVQLYSVALTAGKAHKDHKHHHVHHFDHYGRPLNQGTTPPPATAAPLLAPAPPAAGAVIGGQINQPLELNLGNGPPQLVPTRLNNGLVINRQLINGQFRPGGIISEQLFGQYNAAREPQRIVFPQQNQLPSNTLQLQPQQGINSIDLPFLGSQQFNSLRFTRKAQADSETNNPTENDKKRQTRGLVQLPDGAIVDDSVLDADALLNGLAGLGNNIPVQTIQKQSDEREPAEAEVRAVMNICNGCEEEPFLKALVIGWRSTPKKVFSGAFYYPASPTCKAF